MSHALIARNKDLERLKESGYTLRFVDGFILVDDIPYINNEGHIKEAALALKLDLSGDSTVQPSDHVAYWTGKFPYKKKGGKLQALGESAHSQILSDGTTINYMFSAKPTGGRYRDYEHKVKTYIEIIEREARMVDPNQTAQKWKVNRDVKLDDVFEYMETASARQNTTDISAKVENEIVAIVGLGGTGSYVLDFVAKTWVKEIHLYDGDRFLQHNAFRAPGATGIEDLEGGPNKAAFHAGRYKKFRKGVIGHSKQIDDTNLGELKECNTVFMCIDGNLIKRDILRVCEEAGSVCIDTGMGIYREDDKLGGIIRVTTSAPTLRRHIERNNRIDMAGGGIGEYERNFQMAELNALNASLAVIKWKKIRGVYQDITSEGDSGYILDGNRIINRDQIEERANNEEIDGRDRARIC